jgi:Flp pilus assembly protein CpaB
MKSKNLVLMVVAVGCGLVAAILTSQMSAKTGPDTVEVIVAVKDLPVGMVISREDIPKVTKRKRVSKDSVLPNAVESEDELIDKRLSRPIRAEEPLNKADLGKGVVVQIPPGKQMFTLAVSNQRAVAGFVGPGSHVDVLGTVRLGSTLRALPILVNMQILAVDTNTTGPDKGSAFVALNSVSFAVDRKQALLLELAQARGCNLSLLLRNPQDRTENDEKYNIDEVIKLLQSQRDSSEVIDPEVKTNGTEPNETKPTPSNPAESPKPETVKVRVAIEDIKAGTEITSDLLSEKFKDIDLPKELADGAITDQERMLGKFLRNGLGKGQWVTRSLIGEQELKPSPIDAFNEDKGGPPVTAGPTPPKPEPDVPGRKPTRDVSIHTPAGTKVYRYQEVKPGEWKLIGEVSPARSADDAARRID